MVPTLKLRGCGDVPELPAVTQSDWTALWFFFVRQPKFKAY